MSEKTTEARLNDDLDNTIRRLADAEAHHKRCEQDLRAARRNRDDLMDRARSEYRALLMLGGATPDSTALHTAQVDVNLARKRDALKEPVR